jgi:transcriptional regulator with XRE-family HTH domain
MTSRRLLGPAAKAIRVANKLPQGDAALRLDISQGYLSNLEKGAKQPSEILMRQMAELLGVEIDAISYVVTDDTTSVGAA